MKMCKPIVMLLAGLVVMTSARGAFTAPGADQISAIVADHSLLNAVIQDANAGQIAGVVGQALNKVNSGAGVLSSKSQQTALLYTRALLLSGENAGEMVSELIGQVDPSQLPVIAAATAIAMGSSEGPLFTSLGKAAGAGSDAVMAAAVDPASVLDEESMALVQQLVIELRGVAAAVIPPPATAPMNLVPPIVPQSPEGTAPPPVAPPYVNQ